MRLKYVFNEVLVGLWRNVTMTVAMIITMSVSLTMLGASVLIQPAGAVFGLTAQDAPKKGDDKTATSTAKKTDKKNMKKGTTGTKKGGKKKQGPVKSF